MPDDAPAERFASTERYYAEYRPGYGERVVDFLVERFGLNGTARVLDLGCGAGQLTLPLARPVETVVAMDPNEAMLDQAKRRAAASGVENVEWVVGSDADLDAALGPLGLTVMGRSFHWMDQERTLRRLFEATEPGGGVALLTDREWLTKGRADWQAAVYDVVSRYLDDLPDRVDPETVIYDDPWDETLRGFGFDPVETATFDLTREWSVEGVVGYVLSLSFASPVRFGDDRAAFETDLRERLADVGPGPFVERTTVEAIVGERPATDPSQR